MIPDLVLALVDKSLSILDNNGLKYKMKVEVCKLLQLFALKMIQTPEEFQKTEFELILSKLKYLSIDRILRVQMAAKSALKRWKRLHVRVQNLDKDSMDLIDPNDLKNEESLILKKIKKSNPKVNNDHSESDKGTFSKMNSIQRGIDCFIENNLVEKTYHKQNAHNFIKKRSGIGGGFVKHIDNYKAHAGKPSFNVIREQLKRRILKGNITVREDGSVHIEGEDSESENEKNQKFEKSEIQEESEEVEDSNSHIEKDNSEDDRDIYVNPEDSLEVEIPQRDFKKENKHKNIKKIQPKIPEKNIKKIKVDTKNPKKQIDLKAQSERKDFIESPNTSRDDGKRQHPASERINMKKKKLNQLRNANNKRQLTPNYEQQIEQNELLRVSEVSEEDQNYNRSSMKKTIEKNQNDKNGNNNFMPTFEMEDAPGRQQAMRDKVKNSYTPETQPTYNNKNKNKNDKNQSLGRDRMENEKNNGPELTEITRATHLNKGDLSVSQLPEYKNNHSVERTDPYYSPTYQSAQEYDDDDLQDTIDLRQNNQMMGSSGLSETIKVVENEYIDPAETRKASEYGYHNSQDADLADTIYFGHQNQNTNPEKNKFSNNYNNNGYPYDIRQNISIGNTEPGRHYYETQHQQELEIDLDDVRKYPKNNKKDN